MYLYRTRLGMKLIDYIGGKYKKTLKFFSYISIFCGYILMITMIYLLGRLVYIYVMNPEIVRAIKVPPLIPLIPYLPSLFKITFLPPFYFTYWIIAIAVIAIFHEFAHGILMKRYNIGIKSTGFGFLGPFLAAFVEQDEKEMKKASKFSQISVLSAGTFTNLILSIIFFLLLGLFFMGFYQESGALFNTYTMGAVSIANITSIGGISINNLNNSEILNVLENNNFPVSLKLENGESIDLIKITANEKNYYMNQEILENQLTNQDYVILYEDYSAINSGLKGAIISINGNEIKNYNQFVNVMKNYSPGDEVLIKTEYENSVYEYNINLSEDPNQKGKGIIGIGIINPEKTLAGKIFNFFNFFKEDATYYKPKFNSNLIIFIYNLLWWLAIINISVALVNMLPMGIFDGGRMFMLTIWGITKSEKFAILMYKIATYFILGIFAILMLTWFTAIF